MKEIAGSTPVSATIGDFSYKPGTASLAALGAAGYADYKRINSISPIELPAIGAKTGVDVVMMDTGIKDGRSTFEFLTEFELPDFVAIARGLGLNTALAGTIKFENIPLLKRIEEIISIIN